MTISQINSRLAELRARAETGEATKADLDEARQLLAQRDRLQGNNPGEDLFHIVGPSNGDRTVGNVSSKFASVGEYFQAIAATVAPADSVWNGRVGNFAAGRLDPRLAEHRTVLSAATGGSIGVPSDGGFLTGTELSNELLAGAFETGLLASRVRRRTLSGPNNSLSLNMYDETSRADGSRYGGVRGYWTAEADDVTKSKPKFRQVDLGLNKLAGLYYATDELLQDATALEGEIREAFSSEFGFKIDDAIINGDGAGKPLGILNSPALVTQDKESGQTSDTIVTENIAKMYARWVGQKRNGVWIANRDTFPELFNLTVAVGTGGSSVGLVGNNIAADPYDRLLRMPVLEMEQAATLGDAGDLILMDPKNYMLVDKGGMVGAVSIHVEFVADEVVFRFVYRVDGSPLPASAITPFKGSDTRSPFVTLQART